MGIPSSSQGPGLTNSRSKQGMGEASLLSFPFLITQDQGREAQVPVTALPPRWPGAAPEQT